MADDKQNYEPPRCDTLGDDELEKVSGGANCCTGMEAAFSSTGGGGQCLPGLTAAHSCQNGAEASDHACQGGGTAGGDCSSGATPDPNQNCCSGGQPRT